MAVLVITAPDPLVTLEDVKAHLRVETDDEDVVIEGYIDAASAWIDGPAGWLGRSIGAQVLELRTEGLSVGRLPFGPVDEIVSIVVVDEAGAETTLAPDAYRLIDEVVKPGAGGGWGGVPAQAEVRIRYRAGSDEIPAPIRQAVLLLIGQWFRHRSSVAADGPVGEMPFAVDALLSPFRRWSC